jgi:3alpha(or 20beta)-hydroxysteroid dehydrogenase
MASISRVVAMKLQGKVAVVTGGGGAMGGAQARLFAKEGAAVCVADLYVEKAQVVAQEIVANGGNAIAAELDVQRSDQWHDAIDRAERAFGPVSILCNNAGANFRTSFDEQNEEMWNIIVGTILTGSFLGTKAVIPSMRRAGGGTIVNLGSLASIRPGAGSPGYGAAKMGLVGLTRCTAGAYAKENIRCVLVSPGHVDTPFLRENNPYSPNDERTSIDNPENYERRLRSTPMGRLMTPEDIARTFLFVVSDDAAMITGSMITVDGGSALM